MWSSCSPGRCDAMETLSAPLVAESHVQQEEGAVRGRPFLSSRRLYLAGLCFASALLVSVLLRDEGLKDDSAGRTSELMSLAGRQASPQPRYLPVIAMHGMNMGADFFDSASAWIQSAHPGTKVHALPILENAASWQGLPLQMRTLERTVRELVNSNPEHFKDGYHLMCHSLGALLCRALTQFMDDHKVHTLIAVAGPQLGVYGSIWLENNHLSQEVETIPFLGGMVHPFAEMEKTTFFRTAYTPGEQGSSAPAGLWNDPFHEAEFSEKSVFLPLVNGLRGPVPPEMRENFLRIRKGVFLGGSVLNRSYDGQIGVDPWCSELFGYWAQNSLDVMVPMQQQRFYIEDTFGLRSLHALGRLNLTLAPGVTHTQWFREEVTFQQYILPHLV